MLLKNHLIKVFKKASSENNILLKENIVLKWVHRFGIDSLKDSGILDPTKVIRLALQDSVSIAAMLLTTEVAMADIPQPEVAAPRGPGGDPMGGMGGMGMPGMM